MLSAILFLLVICIIFLYTLKGNISKSDSSIISNKLDLYEKIQERTERAIKDDIVQSRQEMSTSSTELRQEINNLFEKLIKHVIHYIKSATNSQKEQLELFSTHLNQYMNSSSEKLDGFRNDSNNNAKELREEINKSIKDISDTMFKAMRELSEKVVSQLDKFSSQNDELTKKTAEKIESFKVETAAASKALKEDISANEQQTSEMIEKTLKNSSEQQKTQLVEMSENIKKLTESNIKSQDELKNTVDLKLESVKKSNIEALEKVRQDSGEAASQLRTEVNTRLKEATDTQLKSINNAASIQKNTLDSMSKVILQLSESNVQKFDNLKQSVENKLQGIQNANSEKLEQMRQTVDEKLQGTLEKRLGESFKQVSEKLESVHKGLGEMQSLATGVGDLKKVLTNVKTRGTWGEVQLGNLLEQVLTPEQFDTNVATKGGSERVEFAIKLPGQGDNKGDIVWLPIDAKFPIEDYQRLVDAQENADIQGVESAVKQLENRVKGCAKDICEKYLSPPKTTDFGILFVPIEGLFAEIIRRVGLTEEIQTKYRVIIAGPTTLWSILNSLQMGFRTLVIQERSSEVWTTLSAVKTEWKKYGLVLDKVQSKLNQASKTIEDAQTRTRVIGKKLDNVTELPETDATALLELDEISAPDFG